MPFGVKTMTSISILKWEGKGEQSWVAWAISHHADHVRNWIESLWLVYLTRGGVGWEGLELDNRCQDVQIWSNILSSCNSERLKGVEENITPLGWSPLHIAQMECKSCPRYVLLSVQRMEQAVQRSRAKDYCYTYVRLRPNTTAMRAWLCKGKGISSGALTINHKVVRIV